MNIHATIKAVAKHYTMPIKTGSYSWQFTMPHTILKPRDATTTANATSYKTALQKRRAYIAHDVSLLLTKDKIKAAFAMYDVHDGYSIDEAVKRNVK